MAAEGRKVWVRYEDGVTRVSTEGSEDVDDLREAIKKEFSRNLGEYDASDLTVSYVGDDGHEVKLDPRRPIGDVPDDKELTVIVHSSVTVVVAAAAAVPAAPAAAAAPAQRYVYEFMLVDADPAHDDLTDGGFRARVVSLATDVGVVGFIQLHRGRTFRVHVEGTEGQVAALVARLHSDIESGYFRTFGVWGVGYQRAPPVSGFMTFGVERDAHSGAARLVDIRPSVSKKRCERGAHSDPVHDGSTSYSSSNHSSEVS